MDLAVVVENALRLVSDTGDGEVRGQDGVGVDKQIELTVDGLLSLLLRTVLFTEETGTLGDHLLVDAGACGHHAGRIPLYEDRRGADGQLSRPDVAQVVVAVAGIVPLLQLTVEEPLQRRVVHQFLLALQHLLAGQDLERAQTVLIEVVGIDAVDAQGSIAVASPSATEIQLAEDAADAVVARYFKD